MPSSRRTTLGVIQKPNPSSRNNRVGVGNNNEKSGVTKSKKTRTRATMDGRVPGQEDSLLLPRRSNDGRSMTNHIGGAQSPQRHKVGANSKRQSSAGTSLRNDPRPINDKAYHNACLHKLHQYLTSKGYELLTMKQLARPSGADFKSVLTFLLHRLDASFNDHSMKFEDDVVITLKRLNYPCPVSRTSLAAAGSPHTWPTLTNILTWLVELSISIEAGVGNNENDTLNEEETEDCLDMKKLLERTDAKFFQFIGKSYKAFLSNDDEQCKELEYDFIEYAEEDNKKIEFEINKIVTENEEIFHKVEQLRSLKNAIPETEQKAEEMQAKLEGMFDLVKKLENYKSDLDKSIQKKSEEVKRAEKDLERSKAKVTSLTNAIKSQGLTADDIRKIQREKAHTQKAIDGLSTTKIEKKKYALEQETNFQNAANELRNVVKDTNVEMMSMQKLLTSEVNNTPQRQQNFFLEVDATKAVNDDLSQVFCGVNIHRKTIPDAMFVRDEASNEIGALQSMILEFKKQNDHSILSIQKEKEMNERLKDKNVHIESKIEREEETRKKEILDFELEVQNVEEKKISRDPTNFDAVLQHCQTRLYETESEKKKVDEEFGKRKYAVIKEIQNAIAATADHKDKIQQKLSDLALQLEQEHSSLEEITTFPDVL